jgi:hypothetical protein
MELDDMEKLMRETGIVQRSRPFQPQPFDVEQSMTAAQLPRAGRVLTPQRHLRSSAVICG